MKKIIYSMGLSLLALIMLVGCSQSSVSNKNYYRLPENSLKQTNIKVQTTENTLFLQPIVLSDLFNYDGIVYQLSEVKYNVAKQHLWATPLSGQLLSALAVNLKNDMPKWVVMTQPLDGQNPAIQVQVTVSDFNGRFDGKVVLKGQWIITHYVKGKKNVPELIVKPFSITQEQQEEGYAELVKTMANAWGEQSKQLAETLQHIVSK